MKSTLIATLLVIVLSVSAAAASQPALSLLKPGTAIASETVAEGTLAYVLEVVLSTGGKDISGLQFSVAAAGPQSVTYSGVGAMAMMDSPFTADDVVLEPGPFSTVASETQIALFRMAAGDYAAVHNSGIMLLSFDTSSLMPGAYQFSPVFVELTNSLEVIDGAALSSFTLMIVPEPCTLGLMGTALAGLVWRKRRS